MKKAVIFDLDGTLANTLDTISYYCNTALTNFGYPSLKKDQYRYMVGDGAKTLVRRMLQAVGDTSEAAFQKVYQFYSTAYNRNVLYLTSVYHGIPSLLTALMQRGVKTAVLSNKPDTTTQMVVTHLFPSHPFTVCFGAREGIPVKPDPAGANAVIQILGIAKEECLYVGDTNVDMQTGRAAGLETVGVLWGFRGQKELEENHADHIIREPNEILELL